MTPDKMNIRADQFDQCVAELSPEAQEAIAQFVKNLYSGFNQMGEMGAKELIWQALLMEDKVNTRLDRMHADMQTARANYAEVTEIVTRMTDNAGQTLERMKRNADYEKGDSTNLKEGNNG